jgi:hypothetical protein|tara:strand:- start:564 stop:779 length:216 start_codon:yes stop_codon:yes gene_type:complete
MDWHGLIEFNKKYQPLYGFQGILLFPNAGRTNFPYSQGITKIDEEKIIQNIKLQTGLFRKNWSRYKKQQQR